MTDPVERLVNLAVFIAAAHAPVTAATVRSQVNGYPAGQDDGAFLRMFERDKEDLVSAGLALRVDRSGDTEGYLLDREATFAPDFALAPEEAMVLRSAGAAMLSDPSFPFAGDLRLALAKVSAAAGCRPAPAGSEDTVAALTADEDPARQARTVSALSDALSARKRVEFDYTTPDGDHRRREIDPYGLSLQDGRWYLVGWDRVAESVRVFAVTRMTELEVNEARPKSPDFETPNDFRVRDWMLLPFQFGADRVDALVRFTGAAASRARSLTRGQGTLQAEDDGSVLWRVPAANLAGLVGWAIENGPGVEVLAPEMARTLLRQGVAKVADAHAG